MQFFRAPWIETAGLSFLARRPVCQSTRFLAFLLLMLAWSGTAAFAWEQDLHEGLTRWLAEQAGFPANEAIWIGLGDQEVDDSPSTDAVPLVERIIAKGDVGASQLVQRFHFPSFGPVPGTPAARRVIPLSFAAREAVEHELDLPVSEKPNARAIGDFGRALHPFQDGWSHQGEPDPPGVGWYPYSDLTFGHPAARGGWRTHDADISYLHVDDTLQTAREPYLLMCRFHSHRSGKEEHPPDWTSLERAVRAFALARTKSAKRDWFTSHGFSGDEADRIVRYLSIEDGNFDSSSALPHVVAISPSHGPPSPQLLEPYETAFRFLQTWIVDRYPGKSVSQFVNISDLSEQLKATGLSTTDASSWLPTFLTAWLIADHGFVNRVGHGWAAAEAYRLLPNSPQQADAEATIQKSYRTFRFGKLEEAIRGQAAGSIFDLVAMPPDGSKPRCAVMFSFRHTPHDALVLMLRKTRTWQIDNIFWVTS